MTCRYSSEIPRKPSTCLPPLVSAAMVEKGFPDYSIAREIAVYQAKGIDFRNIEPDCLETTAGSMRIFKSAVQINPGIGTHGFLCSQFIAASIFASYGIKAFAFLHFLYRAFGIQLISSSAIKPAYGSAVGNPFRSGNADMGRSKALAQGTAIKLLYILILQAAGSLISGFINSSWPSPEAPQPSSHR